MLHFKYSRLTGDWQCYVPFNSLIKMKVLLLISFLKNQMLRG